MDKLKSNAIMVATITAVEALAEFGEEAVSRYWVGSVAILASPIPLSNKQQILRLRG